MIWETIKQLRKKRNLTQQEIADLLGIDRSTYASYELGRIKPNIETIMSLAKIFDVHYTQILESESAIIPYLSDISKQKPLNDYNALELQEQKLVSIFRMLPENARNEVIDMAYKKIKKRPIKK